MNTFELFVAFRYLRIRRKEAVISVVTLVSVTGVAAGVAALIISLAINNGFRNTLQRDLLGATSHINVMAKEPGQGISDWRHLGDELRKLPHVIAEAPVLYSPVYLSSPLNGTGAVLKGIDIKSELSVSDALKKLKSGSLSALTAEGRYPGILLGSKLAQDIGASTGGLVQVITAQGEMTPFGLRPGFKKFRVAGTFESGFYDLDDKWAYAALPAVQQILSLPDVVNSLELKLDDLYLAPEVGRAAEKLLGSQFSSTNWEDGAAGDIGDYRIDRDCGGHQYSDYIDDDRDGEVSGYRGVDVDGREESADPAYSVVTRVDYRRDRDWGGFDPWLWIELSGESLSLDSAGCVGVCAELGAV